MGGYDETTRKVVKELYAKGFEWQAVAMTAFGGAGVAMLLLFLEREFRRMEKTEKGKAERDTKENPKG